MYRQLLFMIQMFKQMLVWPRATKRMVVIVVDVILALLATWTAYTLRLETLHWPRGTERWIYLLAPTLAVPIFIWFGLYLSLIHI